MRKREICQWTRVKARSQLSAKTVRVYDIQDDLDAAVRAAEKASTRFFLEQPFIFHPNDAALGPPYQKPSSLALSEQELYLYAKQVTKIRASIAHKARALFEETEGKQIDVADLDQSIPKSLQRTYSRKAERTNDGERARALEDVQLPYRRKPRRREQLSAETCI